MKKIFKIIFIFVLGFLFLNKIEATNYTYSCDYVYVDEDLYNWEWYYTFYFEVNGNTINLTKAVLHEDLGYDSDLNIEMKGAKWENNKDCPGYITITEQGDTKKAELGIKESGKVITHYWTWDCLYTVSTTLDNMGFITLNMTYINYYNSKIKFVTKSISQLDGSGAHSNKFFVKHSSDSDKVADYGKYENSCVPLNLSITDHVMSFSYADDGKINGGLNTKISYNKEIFTTTQSSCLDYRTKASCETDQGVACVWTENDDVLDGGFCNVDNLLYVGCGDASDIPMQVPQIISFIVNFLKIATPIILIIIGMISLFKSMAAGKEDEMKKAQSALIKKIIAAVLVFFVVAIVQFIISLVAEDKEYRGFESCLNCFLNNKCTATTYYKTTISGEEYCTGIYTKNTSTCSDYFDLAKKLY